MLSLFGHPAFFFCFVLLLLACASALGTLLRKRYPEAVDRDSSSFKTLEGAVLGMLGLLLGFSFAMAVSRYDLRHDLEVAESNALGTSWLRTATLAPAAAGQMRTLLRQYVGVRLQWVADAGSPEKTQADLDRGNALQTQIWAIATASSTLHRDPVSSLLLASLNDSFDSAEKRTAAYENRIPAMAWVMLIFIGAISSFIVGIGIRSHSRPLLALLPLIVAAVLMLIRDLDSPRIGFIHVQQQSMDRVAQQAGAPTP